MSYINTLDIQQTLDGQLLTISSLPTLSVENTQTVQAGTTPYCRSTLAPAKTTLLTMGSKKGMKQTGLYQVDLFYPTNYGYMDHRKMSDLIIAAFPPGTLTLSTGENLIILSAWSQPGRNVQDAFLQVPIQIEWVAYTIPQ